MAWHSDNRKHDARVDPGLAIRQWILDARLAGGVHGDCDMSDALGSARVVAEGLQHVWMDDSTRFFFDAGVQYLCAYMVAMANEPGDDVEVNISQARLADLATRQSDARVRDELVRGATCLVKVFSACRFTLRWPGD